LKKVIPGYLGGVNTGSSSADVKIIQVAILRFFAPQGRLGQRIIVKFGIDEGTLCCAKF